MENVHLIVCDVDGVLTDGGMYYGSDGSEFKKFSVYDGGAPLLAANAGLRVVVMSGEDNKIIKDRCIKIGIEDFRLGIKNKNKEITEMKKQYKLENDEILVIVDFINDLDILERFKSVCPQSAPEVIKRRSDSVISVDGGDGVLWAVTRNVLQSKGVFGKALNKFRKG